MKLSCDSQGSFLTESSKAPASNVQSILTIYRILFKNDFCTGFQCCTIICALQCRFRKNTVSGSTAKHKKYYFFQMVKSPKDLLGIYAK